MIIETKEIYKCEYCRKIYQRKNFAELHEVICKKNPLNNRACFGCKFLLKKETTIYVDHPVMGEFTYKKDLLFCNKKRIYVYPPIVEYKGNAVDLGNEFNETMPKKCDLYADIDFSTE
jgi:hypothetical protein